MTATLTSPELVEVEGKLKKIAKDMADVFSEARTDNGELDLKKVKGIDGTTAEKAAQIKAWNDEMTDLGVKRDDLRILLAAASTAYAGDAKAGTERGDAAGETKAKSWIDQISDSGVFETKSKLIEIADLDIKTTFSTAAGWSAPVLRTDRLVDFATRAPIGAIDLIPTTTTTTAAITYMEETTFTNAAVETDEGAAKPEATLALTERTSTVRKIAVFLPVTDEQLADVPRVRGYLENRLPFMIRQRLSGQVLVGNGTAPNLRGLLNVAGIQTQAKGADPTPDAVYKAMVLVMTTGQAMPNGAVFNPLDWQDIRLLRTVDGIYIWGNPSDAGPNRIWGLDVALDQALTQNTGIVADFTFTELAIRQGLTVEVGYNADDWTKNKQTFRAEMRAAFICYRPTAVCSITGI